jgi:TfoX/Sxy family transcriptional regulator of competence genes
MATREDTAQYIVDQLVGLSGVSTRKMFGEYALYLENKVVALICDDQFFLKPTEAGAKLLDAPAMAPPYPGAKLYYVLVDELEQREVLKRLVQATANALPVAKAKTARKAPVKKTIAKAAPANKVPAKKRPARRGVTKSVVALKTTRKVASKAGK